MRILALRRPTNAANCELLEGTHQLRAKLFQERLSWGVRCVDGKEWSVLRNRLDIYRRASSADRVIGCARGFGARLGKWPQFSL